MAITLKSAQQVNPGGCRHYRLEIDVDGRVETRVIHLDELKQEQTDPVLGLVSRFVEGKRISITDLAGKVLVEDVPREATVVTRLRTLMAPSENSLVRRFVNWWVS